LDRKYAFKDGVYVRATKYGITMIRSYQEMGLDLYQPQLRAEMEKDITKIA
jgi:DNA topoisomerase IA